MSSLAAGLRFVRGSADVLFSAWAPATCATINFCKNRAALTMAPLLAACETVCIMCVVRYRASANVEINR